MACRGHHDVVLENLALRHQLRTLQRRVKRPHLRTRDRMFWVLLATAWRRWRSALVLVQPETVIRWHRTWLPRRWARRSGRNRAGRPPLDPHVARLVTDMAGANPLWSAPRIHGELLKLGIAISERTVSRLLAQLSRPPSQPWRTFLANHLSALVSMDFFTVSTLTGRVLFVLVLMSHDRRSHRARQRHRAPHLRVDRPAVGRSVGDAARSPASGDHTATTSFFFHRETRFVSREERQPLPSVGAVREDWETVIPTSGPQLDWDGERIYGVLRHEVFEKDTPAGWRRFEMAFSDQPARPRWRTRNVVLSDTSAEPSCHQTLYRDRPDQRGNECRSRAAARHVVGGVPPLRASA